MGSSKEYIALPTSDKQTPDSPPPYEVNKSPWFRRHWKVTALMVTFATLLTVGFFIHPSCQQKKRHIKYVDLGFPHDSQHENLAKQDLSRLMTDLVNKVEKPHDKPHHRHHHHDKHRPHHGHHHDQESPQHLDQYHQAEYEEPDNIKHHKPDHHKSEHHRPEHHGHHHQPEHRKPEHKPNHHRPEHHRPEHKPNHHRPEHHRPEHKPNHHRPEHHRPEHHNHHRPDHHKPEHHPDHHQNEKRDDKEEVYVQKLPTHNRFKTHLGLQRRDEQKQWKQSYRLTPSDNTSLHINIARLHESLAGSVTLRQDTTGMEQDITVTLYRDATGEYDEPLPARLMTKTRGHSFFLRAQSAPVEELTFTRGYSVDIVLPSSMKTIKRLEIEMNNGTISVDGSLRLTFGSVRMTTFYGSISVENLTSDRITLGTYSGVITGTFQPTESFAVGAYHGFSNVRLLQAPSTKTLGCHSQQGLHIASTSPHGISSLTLEHGAFKGRFEAEGRENLPNINFTSNNKETYDYELLDNRVSGWFYNDTSIDQLLIHGRDETNITFE